MSTTVSKVRKRKSKQRQKQADKGKPSASQPAQRPYVGIMSAFTAWAVLLIAFRIPSIQITAIHTPDGFWIQCIYDAILGVAAFIATGLFLASTTKELLRRNSRVILLCVVSIISGLFANLIFNSESLLPTNWQPLAICAMPVVLTPLLVSLLLGARAGIAAGVLSASIMAIYAERSLSIFIAGSLATCLIAYLAPKVRTRSKALKICLYAGLIQLPVIALMGVSASAFRVELFLAQISVCVGSAIGFGVLTLLLLPIIEHVFNLSSNISLLEFSDLGHPILQRLALEAPGTYHHSLVVANIAQAAAEAIGANSLEARISAYFHDIGKLTKPEFFAENMFNQDNPHDQLSPNMSTLVITSHVKEGLSMAMLHKLPACVHRAIQEHHGSTVLQCFHHKAVTTQQELELNDAVARPLDDSQFRYPGPKPSTRISAIICLADAVEAASRCIAKPTPANIEELVHAIVRKRLDDGQLDNCELSLLELSKVKRAFVFTLANMLHGRVAYPDNNENNNKNSSEEPPLQENGAAEADKTADATTRASA